MNAMTPITAAPTTMKAITEQVAAKHALSLDDLRGPSPVRRIAHPRHEAWFEIEATGLFSLTQIANYFGGRNHTTVYYGIKAHRERNGMATSASVAAGIAARIEQHLLKAMHDSPRWLTIAESGRAIYRADAKRIAKALAGAQRQTTQPRQRGEAL